MLSRVANACCWMSRHVERAENNARIIAVNTQLLLDFENQKNLLRQDQWEPILATFDASEKYRALYPSISQENILDFLTHDRRNPNSLVSCIAAARENARAIREQISSEMWEKINQLHLYLQSPQCRSDFQSDNYNFYHRFIDGSHLFQGVTDATMSHGEAWQFIQAGKLIERADSTSRILDVKYHLLLPAGEQVGGTMDIIQWKAVLRSCSAMEAYLKISSGEVTHWQVAEFLILHESFPRSIRFCARDLSIALHNISGMPMHHFANEAERKSGMLCSNLDFTDIEGILRDGLHEFLDKIQCELIDVSTALTDTYFG